MPLFFNIDNRMRFTVQVMLGNDLDSQSLSQIIMRITTISKKIKQLYTGFMSKEGKIHGQERVQLVEGLDDLFYVLLVLRKKLTDRTPPDDLPINETGRRVIVDMKINKFIAKGILNDNDLSSIVNFNKGYEDLILKEIKELLLKYKLTLESEKTAFDKYMDLYNKFDEIFYNTVLIRYGIENLIIDK
jgi:hypothetical protein